MPFKKRREVAQMFYPFVGARTAMRYLKAEIDRNPALQADLLSAGYRPGDGRFSPKALEVLVKYLGEP